MTSSVPNKKRDSIVHIVGPPDSAEGFSGDQNQAVFDTGDWSRQVIQTLDLAIIIPGEMVKGFHATKNHAMIVLDVGLEWFIQINMHMGNEGGRNNRQGRLMWKLANYKRHQSTINKMTYNIFEGLTVGKLYSSIREWKMERYLYTHDGHGCRYWCYNLLHKLEREGYTNLYTVQTSWRFLGQFYSHSTNKQDRVLRPDITIDAGRFVEDEDEYWNRWYGEDQQYDSDKQGNYVQKRLKVKKPKNTLSRQASEVTGFARPSQLQAASSSGTNKPRSR